MHNEHSAPDARTALCLHAERRWRVVAALDVPCCASNFHMCAPIMTRDNLIRHIFGPFQLALRMHGVKARFTASRATKLAAVVVGLVIYEPAVKYLSGTEVDNADLITKGRHDFPAG